MNADQSREAHAALVEEHVRLENLHDVDGILNTFGEDPRYDDEPWDDHRSGRDGVRSYYQELLQAVPDLDNDPKHRHVTDDAVVLELIISGTQLGAWRGMPATGRRLEFPLCAVYTFDDAGKLAGERIYYDRATVLRQLGLFYELDTVLGRAVTGLVHPVAVARALARTIRRR